MRTTVLSFIFFIAVINSQAQVTDRTIGLLQQLDSIRNSPSVSRHFAGIYLDATVQALHYFGRKDLRIQQLMERCEMQFATYFMEAACAFEKKEKIPAAWQFYYADSNASPLRHILYGANAHINGDIWQTLVVAFTPAEINEIRSSYLDFTKELLRVYKHIHATAVSSSSRIQILHRASLGLDQLYGQRMLVRWRKRQLMLAELYFSNRVLFEKKLQQLHRRMDKLNRLIRRHT